VSRTIADLIQDRFGLPTEAGRDRAAEGPLALLLSHRTQRRYKPDAVPDDVLEMALAAALSAPSKSDLQQVGIVVVRDRARQTTIGGWIPDMPWIAQAPLFLVFCGDHRRMRRVSELRGRPFPNDTLDMFMNAAVDAGLVLQAFITAAEALGLGCCPISVVRNHVEKLAALLELPPGVFPVAGLCVGYPLQPGWISLRLPPAITVHTDRYDDRDLPAQLEAYDRRREARHATRRRASATWSGSGTPSPTAGRRTRPASTRHRSGTTSARSSAGTGSGSPDLPGGPPPARRRAGGYGPGSKHAPRRPSSQMHSSGRPSGAAATTTVPLHPGRRVSCTVTTTATIAITSRTPVTKTRRSRRWLRLIPASRFQCARRSTRHMAVNSTRANAPASAAMTTKMMTFSATGIGWRRARYRGTAAVRTAALDHPAAL
jgi:nitroreductase